VQGKLIIATLILAYLLAKDFSTQCLTVEESSEGYRKKYHFLLDLGQHRGWLMDPSYMDNKDDDLLELLDRFTLVSPVNLAT
jgi:hypothetical protein